jgi:hypothetical protein
MVFLVAGTHALKRFTGGYWSVFFNLAVPIDIGTLTEPDTRWLITEPVKQYYSVDTTAVSEIVRITGCHPYFAQLVCLKLLEVRNESRLNVMSVGFVEDAVERALDAADDQIGYSWTEEECTPDERLVLAVLAKESDGSAAVGLDTIRARIAASGLTAGVGAAKDQLASLGVVRQEGDAISFVVPLLKRWLARKGYDSLESAARYNAEKRAQG